MKRRLLSIFLTFAMILLMLPNVVIMSAVADDAPWDGSGTEQDPYQISSRDDFEAIADAVNGGNELSGVYFKQTGDIYMGGEAEPWPTVGITINNAVHPFRGVFDGGDRNIYGLYVNRSNDDAGLFGYVGEGGVIKNVHVKDGDVSGTYWVGGIAGRNYGLVEYCSFSGEVCGRQQYIGGIVGDNHGGTVSYCCNEGDVIFNQIGGGVVGRNSGGTVENCYNRGYICADNIVRGYAGGVVGENTDESTVDNCYSDGWVESDGNLACGAIVGANGKGSTVKNCYYPEEFEEDGLSGVGSGFGTIENVTPKSEDQFDSGEVAWELSQGTNGDGWGQTLKDENDNHDKHPHFTQAPDKDYETTPIYRVLFKANDPNVYPDLTTSYYVDPGDDVDLPKLLLPGAAWFVGSEEFYGKNIRQNYNVLAGKRILFTADDGTIVHGLTYSPEAQEIDLDIYLKYAKGGPYSEGLFDYEITLDVNSLGAELKDEKYLVIPAGTSVRDGGYTLNITATEKNPFIMPLSTKPVPQLSVQLKLNIIIEKATPTVTVTAADIVYGTALSGSTLTGSAEHPTAGVPVEGNFTWDGSPDDIIPTVNEAATTGYYVTFTPRPGTLYAVNYNSVTVMTTVNVSKALSRVVKAPEEVHDVYNGEAEFLVNDKPAVIEGGILKYWLGSEPPADNSGYSATIPSRANAGRYEIWYKVFGDENHEDSTAQLLTSEISPFPLTINESVYYNGGKTFYLELPGVRAYGEDRIVVAKITTDSQNAGSYGYPGAAAKGSFTAELSDSNYVVNENVQNVLEIKPLPVALKWKEPLVFEEDGSPHKVEAVVTNRVAGDTVDLTYSGNSAESAGYYTAKVTRLSNDNYTLNADNGDYVQNAEQPWRIFKNNGYITLVAKHEKGTEKSPVTYGDEITFTAAVTDFYGGDTVKFYINGQPISAAYGVVRDGNKFSVTIPNATTNENFALGANVIRAELLRSGKEEDIDAITVSVEPKSVTLEFSDTDKTYDGNNYAVGIRITLNGAEENDDVTVTADCTYNNARAGDNKTITVNNITLIGAQSGNYTTAKTTTTKGNIAQKPVKLEWRGVNNLIYSGDVPNVTATATETIQGDECTVTVSTDNRADAGRHEAKAIKLSNNNYTLPDEDSCAYDIDQADLYIKSQTIRYNGAKTLTATADGVTPTGKADPEQVDVNVIADSPDVGDYTYYSPDGTDNGAEANNYRASTENANYRIAGGALLTIEKAAPIYEPPVPNLPVYSGAPQELVTAEKVIGGEMQYSLSENGTGTYYPEIPTGVGVEGENVTITVWYRVIGDQNHYDVVDPPMSVDVTVYATEDDVPEIPGDDDTNPPNLPGGGIVDDPHGTNRPNRPNSPGTSDGGSSNDDPNAPDPSDSDTTKQPDSPDGPNDNPHTGADINFALYFVIMCGCGMAVAGIFRKVR